MLWVSAVAVHGANLQGGVLPLIQVRTQKGTRLHSW